MASALVLVLVLAVAGAVVGHAAHRGRLWLVYVGTAVVACSAAFLGAVAGG